MAWQPIRSILSGKLLFEYDPERRLIRYPHRRTEELIDLAAYHDCAERLAETVATALEAAEEE